MADINLYILATALLMTLSIVLGTFSARFGFPLLLIFLAVGMLAGEDGIGRIPFDNYPAAYLIGNLALAIILLDGGLRTRVENFRVGLWPALSLATFGVVITAGLCGLFAAWLLGLPILLGILLGAIIGSTDAAAVFSLLNNSGTHLKQRVSSTLEIESGSNDPMAIFLTVALLEALTSNSTSLGATLLISLFEQLGIGSVMGIAGGLLSVPLINRLHLADGLYPLLITALGILIFALTNLFGGSGILAVYLTGIFIGNQRIRNKQGILQVLDGLAWLAQIGMFLILGLLVSPSRMLEDAIPGLAIALFLIFIARPVAVGIGLAPFVFSLRETLFVAWVGLRGAVPIVLALFPMMAGLPQAELLFNIAFVVVLVSLLLQGFTISQAARLLQVEVPPKPMPVQRMALELAKHQEFEIFVFHLNELTHCNNIAIKDLGMPTGTRISALFRNENLLYPKKDDIVRAGDFLLVIGKSTDLVHLSRMFSAIHTPKRLDNRIFYGDFLLDGAARIMDIKLFYGLDIPIPGDKPDINLAQYIAQRFGGHPVVGDQIEDKAITFVVADVQGDEIRKVGMKWNQPAGSSAASSS